MKKLILLAITVFAMTTAYSQEKYEIDGNNIVVSKVVENVKGTKDEIYGRVKSYFTRSYGSANAVIQTDDKASGLVIGKGLYTELASFNLGAWDLKAYHILRVDIKEGRVRILCSASTIIPNSLAHLGDEYGYEIVDHYPITNKRAEWATKKAQENAFNNLVVKMNNTVASLEEAIKSGGVLESEKEDW